MNSLNRKFFLGFIRIHILHHASKDMIYGTEMIKELQRHGYTISPGTLYPILHELEEKRLLRSEERNINGKIRRYYRITEEGKRFLIEAKKKIIELVEEVLEEK